MIAAPTVRLPNQEYTDSIQPWDAAVFGAFDAGCRKFYQRRHRRGRKSTLWLNILIRECMSRTRAEARTFAYFGPTFKQVKRIVWIEPNMLFKWLPDRDLVPWKKNEAELLIEFPNGCVLQFVGLDDPDNARGIDPWGCVFDEWPLIKPAAYTEVISPIIAADPQRWVGFIFTPKGQDHAYEMDLQVEQDRFADGGRWYYECLTVDDTGLIPAPELEYERLSKPTAVIDQEYYCRYITDEEMTLITSAMLDRLRNVERTEIHTKKLVSCDPAMGGDACVILSFKNSRVVDKRVIYTRSEGEIIGELLAAGTALGTDDFIIDADGLGQPIASRLGETGKNVQQFRAMERSSDPTRFRHTKDEAWWYARSEVQACRVIYPDDIHIRTEVSSIRYKRFDATGIMNLESKQETKKRIGHSPDHGDAWVMGLWGLRNVEDDSTKTAYRDGNDYDTTAPASVLGGMAT